MIIDDARSPLLHLIRDLQDLGFSDYEARAYIALLKLQPATAYEVSKEAGLPKANSYTVLESLSSKEAVQPVSENPVRYSAVAPQTLFERIADNTQRRCDRVREGLSKLADLPRHEYVWSITGRDVVASRIEQMIGAARGHLWIKASEQILEPHRRALEGAAKRNVAILIILFGSHPERFEFGRKSKTWLHEGNGIPVGIAPSLITITRDFEEALVAEMRDDAYGSYTRNKPIVSMAETLIRHEIYFAEIFEIYGREIQDTFGPALFKLRQKYLPREQVRALKARLDNAEDAGSPKSAA
ncbi:MAG: helix-turn-helix domain-containing protein [Rhodomicrobiaceae bacterium]